jgi:hypothetical protein
MPCDKAKVWHAGGPGRSPPIATVDIQVARAGRAECHVPRALRLGRRFSKRYEPDTTTINSVSLLNPSSTYPLESELGQPVPPHRAGGRRGGHPDLQQAWRH